ncbi:MAG: hypothetical protein ACYSSP_13375 [Planctomycetota bacterium]|jgi:transcription elongation factor Elf1
MNMSEHNAKVRRYHEKIKSEGLKCKYCGHESKDYRLVDSKYGLSTLTCRKCEQDVIISEEP